MLNPTTPSVSKPTNEETKTSVNVVVQPLASVMVTEYKPLANPEISSEGDVNPDGPVHEKLYGGTPPETVY